MSDPVTHIDIIPFTDELASYFTELNKQWLEKYFELEPIDTSMLSEPKKYYIERGGHLFFASLNGEIAGTYALLKNEGSIYELSKMAVAEAFQGRKIGNSLVQHCIEQATLLSASKIILYSNTLLQPAIHLYKKYGFKEVPITDSGYRRSNIKMELITDKAQL